MFIWGLPYFAFRLKNIFCFIKNSWFYSLSVTLNMSLHCFLASIVSDEKSDVNVVVPLWVKNCFSVAVFRIFFEKSLPCSSLSMINQGSILFYYSWIFPAFWLFRLMYFIEFGTFLDIIFSKHFSYSLLFIFWDFHCIHFEILMSPWLFLLLPLLFGSFFLLRIEYLDLSTGPLSLLLSLDVWLNFYFGCSTFHLTGCYYNS